MEVHVLPAAFSSISTLQHFSSLTQCPKYSNPIPAQYKQNKQGMIYPRLTVLYIVLDEDELLCWTGTHSPEKSIFVDSGAQSHALCKSILACYCHFPLGDATHRRVALVQC